jgi:UDP-N-acetylmuramoylalanine--D-glutamate ligase
MKDKYLGKRVAVLGLGIEGRDAINFLLGKGADITLFDAKDERELDFSGIDKRKIKIITGKKYLKDGLNGFELVVRSPGVYRFIPEINKAEAVGVKITSAIKIFFDECPGKIVGVTGTKGKGTTSTLIFEILKKGGKDVFLAGNIGKPYLELLPRLGGSSWVIMEMSSFQLIDMEVSPHIAVVLNVTSDHLDWHKSLEEYVRSKVNIVKYQDTDDFAVINEEYETSRDFAADAEGKIVFFSKEELGKKYKEDLLLRGRHNLENIAAAVAVGECVGISEEIILKAVRSFKGLEHRLELVGKVGGVTFYNDSFATGPQPTIAAVNSFSEPETLILGGSDKGLDYGQLRKVIEGNQNVRNLILIGNIGEKIGAGIPGKDIFNLGRTSMTRIVKKAFEVTPEGGVVILSPAAASFDMFKNYKDRGNQYKNAVKSLPQDRK